MVEPFDPPTQNPIIIIAVWNCIFQFYLKTSASDLATATLGHHIGAGYCKMHASAHVSMHYQILGKIVHKEHSDFIIVTSKVYVNPHKRLYQCNTHSMQRHRKIFEARVLTTEGKADTRAGDLGGTAPQILRRLLKFIT